MSCLRDLALDSTLNRYILSALQTTDTWEDNVPKCQKVRDTHISCFVLSCFLCKDTAELIQSECLIRSTNVFETESIQLSFINFTSYHMDEVGLSYFSLCRKT